MAQHARSVGLHGAQGPTVRPGLLALLAILIVGVAMLWLNSVRLERQLAAEHARIEGLADLLERAEGRNVTRDDFESARAVLDEVSADLTARVDSLEARARARERVISEAGRAIVFLQANYGFVESDTGRHLRYYAAPDGSPLRLPNGQTPVTVSGNGPIVQIFYTGTGFVATGDGHLLTNRHVAVPWDYEEHARSTLARGFDPVMRAFIGYLPGVVQSFEVEVVGASKNVDLAVLRFDAPGFSAEPLELRETLPSVGDEVIVMGYPAGVEALLARADTKFAEGLLSTGPVNFWEVAKGLAAGGYIEPLATMGIVGQVTSASIVYDAETAYGGSGGPVLDLDGKVVAVNAAIVREFGGSNLGVPAAEALRLIEKVAGPLQEKTDEGSDEEQQQ